MFNRGLIAAMEDESQQAELAIDQAGPDSMEASMVDVVDMGADIDSGANEMEGTIDDAGQLERHVEVLTEAQSEGGASPELIESTEIAVESIYRRMGLYTETGIPSLESFSTKAGRARNTKIAIEGIKDFLKKIWEAVKAAFRKMVAYVKDFFKKIFGTNERLLARAKALREKARNVEGIPGKKIDGGGITSVISSDRLKDVKASLDVESIKKIFKNEVTKTDDTIPNLLRCVTDQNLFDNFVFKDPGSSDAPGLRAPDGYQWKLEAVVGATNYVVLTPKAGLKGEEAIMALSKLTVKGQNSTSLKDKKEITPATAADCLKIANELEKNIEELKKLDDVSEKIQDGLDKVADLIDELVNKTNAQTEEEESALERRSKEVRAAVSSMGNVVMSLCTKVALQSTRVCQAYLTYGERSLNSYNTKDKKESKADKNSF